MPIKTNPEKLERILNLFESLKTDVGKYYKADQSGNLGGTTFTALIDKLRADNKLESWQILRDLGTPTRIEESASDSMVDYIIDKTVIKLSDPKLSTAEIEQLLINQSIPEYLEVPEYAINLILTAETDVRARMKDVVTDADELDNAEEILSDVANRFGQVLSEAGFSHHQDTFYQLLSNTTAKGMIEMLYAADDINKPANVPAIIAEKDLNADYIQGGIENYTSRLTLAMIAFTTEYDQSYEKPEDVIKTFEDKTKMFLMQNGFTKAEATKTFHNNILPNAQMPEHLAESLKETGR